MDHLKRLGPSFDGDVMEYAIAKDNVQIPGRTEGKRICKRKIALAVPPSSLVQGFLGGVQPDNIG